MEICAEQQSLYEAYLPGTGGTVLSVFAAGALPGIWAAVLVSAGATGATGIVTTAPSSTLPEDAGRALLK